MSDYDGLVFDLDGTLWDSTAACVKGWNIALDSLSVPKHVTEGDIRSIMGMTHEKIYEKLFPEVDLEQRKIIASQCYQSEIDVIREEGGTLFPGVAEGLERLGQRFPLFIVSNCKTSYLDTFLESSGMARLFKDCECYGNTGNSKAQNIADLVKRNGLEKPVYVGDTAGDESAARTAGVPYVHVNYGFGEPVNECWRVDSFKELTEFFLEEV